MCKEALVVWWGSRHGIDGFFAAGTGMVRTCSGLTDRHAGRFFKLEGGFQGLNI